MRMHAQQRNARMPWPKPVKQMQGSVSVYCSIEEGKQALVKLSSIKNGHFKTFSGSLVC